MIVTASAGQPRNFAGSRVFTAALIGQPGITHGTEIRRRTAVAATASPNQQRHAGRDLNNDKGFVPVNQPPSAGLAAPNWGKTFRCGLPRMDPSTASTSVPVPVDYRVNVGYDVEQWAAVAESIPIRRTSSGSGILQLRC